MPRAPGYLDGGGAPLLVLALTQQAVGLHVVAGHRHGLHHVQAVAGKRQTGVVGAGPPAAGSQGGRGGGGENPLPNPLPNPPAHRNQLSEVHLHADRRPQLPLCPMVCSAPSMGAHPVPRSPSQSWGGLEWSWRLESLVRTTLWHPSIQLPTRHHRDSPQGPHAPQSPFHRSAPAPGAMSPMAQRTPTIHSTDQAQTSNHL